MLQEALASWLWTLVFFGVAFTTAILLQRIWGPEETSLRLEGRQGLNFALMFLWTALLYVSWPWIFLSLRFLPVFSARWSQGFSWYSMTLWVLASIALLDFIQYWLHRALHANPYLWRIHALHHSDTRVDASTGVRHHIIEPIVGASVQGVFIVCLGISPAAVLAYAVASNAQAFFAHADIRPPSKWEALVSRLIITSRVHREHHVALPRSENRNYGVLFPWWDQIFRTYSLRKTPTSVSRFGLA